MLTRSVILSVGFFVACADSTPARPDAAPPPIEPAGRFELSSELDLATPLPGPTGDLLAVLRAATDGPDDPSRFLVDHVIASLPDGSLKSAATYLAPFLAGYLQARLADVAPRLVPGLDAIATGLERTAQHVGTVEVLDVARDGTATRTLRGLTFATGSHRELLFGELGLPDLAAPTHVSIDAHTLSIAEHSLAVPLGRILEVDLDHAVIPAVDPGATNLAQALSDLVDCDRLGSMFADALGIGTVDAYRTACRIGMLVAASECYEHLTALDATPLTLSMAGTARALDSDRNGSLDALDQGVWTGTVAAAGTRAPLGAATFAGTRAP